MLFGESQSRIVISFDPADRSAIEAEAKKRGVPFHCLGEVTGGDRFVLFPHIDCCVRALREVHATALQNLMDDVSNAAVA